MFTNLFKEVNRTGSIEYSLDCSVNGDNEDKLIAYLNHFKLQIVDINVDNSSYVVYTIEKVK